MNDPVKTRGGYGLPIAIVVLAIVALAVIYALTGSAQLVLYVFFIALAAGAFWFDWRKTKRDEQRLRSGGADGTQR
ncbi:hypothetical protein JDN40_13440 [Rhodomicrobium vannielii ATCC 17100]|jgi:nicotinamide riboside transporter PnuC|uniref:Uncharacterized protein n=1 Tax=Rhodomicrobium udaipurense TaxID=1202716 RepID=A0A8I1KJK4_9HYPH|nr:MULTISPECIES: hypothetical protein [Rhodomicrobium]KAI95024.1 hypothetical protein T281_07770 [Rhodomicrobium udaipurense JA643]MBJ7535111.1 hypothetical protein [Rhodomicrobium vannielii ATCC 17100]MBJ7543026.1 hypothetical protein [Rhodomicrobium udaipurense]